MKKKNVTSLLALLLSALLLCGCGAAAKQSAATADMAVAEENGYWYGAEAEMAPAEAPAAPMPMPEAAAGGIANTSASTTTAAKAESKGQMQTEKIIYSAYAEVETTEYEKTVEAVSAMVERFGGFIESSSISGANYYRSSRGLKSLRSASFSLRIPCEHFEELTGSLSELGNVPYCNTSSENVTAQYYDVQSRMDAYKTQETRLMEMLAIAETVEDMLAIQ